MVSPKIKDMSPSATTQLKQPSECSLCNRLQILRWHALFHVCPKRVTAILVDGLRSREKNFNVTDRMPRCLQNLCTLAFLCVNLILKRTTCKCSLYQQKGGMPIQCTLKTVVLTGFVVSGENWGGWLCLKNDSDTKMTARPLCSRGLKIGPGTLRWFTWIMAHRKIRAIENKWKIELHQQNEPKTLSSFGAK